jgi:hypothetical protein
MSLEEQTVSFKVKKLTATAFALQPRHAGRSLPQIQAAREQRIALPKLAFDERRSRSVPPVAWLR